MELLTSLEMWRKPLGDREGKEEGQEMAFSTICWNHMLAHVTT